MWWCNMFVVNFGDIIQTTDSVTLDLLTFADLELLRNRKAVNGGYQASNKPRTKHQENKRYLILVYSVEFDR